MAADTIFVVGLIVVFVAWVGYIAIHSRRVQSRRMGAQPAGEETPEPQHRATSE